MDTRSGRALYEDEERYRSVVIAMAEGVILQDAQSVILACNQAAEQLLGLTADQMMGRTSLDPRWHSIHEDGSPFPGDTHPVPVTLRTGKPQRDVVMGVHKPDGSLTWIAVNSEPLFREGETKPYAAVCTFNDITERKRAEDALRRGEERYRRILETTLEGVWLIDLSGNTTYANQRMAEILGCTLDELATSNMWDFVDESDRDIVQQRLAARARGVGEVHEFRFKRKDGTYVWTSLATSSITHPDGTTAALAMVRDVTEARRLAEELRANKEHLELALTAGRLGTWEWTLDTTYCKASPQLLELLGLPPDAKLDTTEAWFRSVHPDDRERLTAAMTAYLQSGSHDPFAFVFRILRGDGAVRWVRCAGSASVMPSGVTRVLGTTADITETYLLEEELQQVRQLESIGRLAGGVAHDFNNLLTAILASVSFAETVAPPDIEEDLRTIRTAAERAADLTRQLLAFARKQVIALEPLDLSVIARNLMGVLRRVVGEDIALSLELANDLWTVRAGASQVEQVIINLVVNAREAMPAGGPLKVETRNVHVDPPSAPEQGGVAEGDYAVLSVTDAGAGIDAATLPHIFEPFYSTKRMGTGLGLASCYGIVKQLGGHIRVRSEPGKGATFTVYLPRDRSAAPIRPTPPVARIARRSAVTILLVEDDEMLRRVIARGLVDGGYQVLVAGDGEQALEVARTHTGPIDVVVTDVVMPRMSGRQLADQLVAVRPTTKILFVSGYTDEIIARHGVLEPGQNFLPKPYSIDALEQRLDELLAR